MRPIVTALLPLALLVGCSGYHVKYDYDVTANFSRYKRFDYYASKKGTGGTTNLMDKRIQAAIERELQGKGFTLETVKDPDFLVTYYPVLKDRKVRVNTRVALGIGGRGFGGVMTTGGREVRHYQEGTIVIEVVDFRSNQMIWQGAAEGALTGLDHPEEANEAVANAVRDILAKFPPR